MKTIKEYEETVKTIKEYEARLGTVKVVYYSDSKEYCVTHSHPAFTAYWTKDKTAAIARAQFLYAKY